MKPAIHLHQVTQDFKTVRALNELSLEVPAGTIYGFLGPNGAGKTTTINILLGLIRPTSGEATVLGFDTYTHPQEIRYRTGALLEHTGVYEHLTAEENLDFYGRVWHMASDLRSARIKELLSPMGLWERRTEEPRTWSRGMKQKLALARVLIHHPELVLLDEPTAGLDVISAAAIRDDLEKLALQHGTTVFLTTHNMAEAQRLCSQVAVIRNGAIVAHGCPDDLRAQTGKLRLEIFGRGFTPTNLAEIRARPEVYSVANENGHISIQLTHAQDTAPLITSMVTAGIQIQEVHKDSASLEEVFLTLMEEENV